MADNALSAVELEALVEFLRQIPLFKNLRTSDLEALVNLATREEYPAGAVIYRQSDADGSLYVIYSGTVGLTHIDPQGAPNDVGARGPGDWLGESSVLLGEPHDVTAIAQTDTTALVFTRDDIKVLSEDDPGFPGRLSPKDENARKIHAPKFGWQASDESIIVFTREHPWSMVRAALLPLGLAAVAAVFAVLAGQLLTTLGIILLVLAAVLLLVAIGYLILDWRNDYYVVTNKRVVHIDELPIIRERREEAPLGAVTEIQFARNSILAQILDFGDLRVETFSGMVAMKDIPHPNEVKDLIQREIERVRARARAFERNAIRDELTKRIITQERTTPPAPLAQARVSPVKTLLPGFFRYFFPKLREVQGDAIIWRKHWTKLWAVAWPPFLGLIVTLWAIINWLNKWFPFGPLPDDVWLLWSIPLVVFSAWWLWLFEDWRNDIYILTGTRIIDIERVPFLLSEKRRETTLSRIQTTEFKIPTPTARFLHYGDLTIRVPGAVFEFVSITDPARAQTDINKRLSEFQKRQAENEARGRRNELSDWFAAYDQIRQPPAAPRVTPPAPLAT
ncbi:MAG TPA: cyclic nucleotide-binding domain-containing protein, partial [Anaerolineae bacterium]|nr:cyclic nucleotide-binding domain-containing protein [Anaerolineae bacterium]